MRVIIAGSRGADDYEIVDQAVRDSGYMITEVVSGGARGADRLGEQWAHRNQRQIRWFLPDWDKLGKKAGIVRNEEMVRYADALIAIWDGESRGTKHTIATAAAKGMPSYVVKYDPREGA